MTFSGSGLVMRQTSLLLVEFPGMMTPSSRKAPSLVSKWNLVSRCFSSGPWQVKQLFDRIGRIWRLKLIGGTGAG